MQLPDDLLTIEDNTFIGQSPVSVYAHTFSMITEDVVQEPITDDITEDIGDIAVSDELNNSEYLMCLINCESGGNENAVGDHGKANGILQFWKSTYDLFCVNQYGFSISDYKNPETQIQCCDKMLDDGLKRHWTCSKVCDK